LVETTSLVSAPFPEFVDSDVGYGFSSCSAAEALERQGPFVNPTLASHALALLARLFRYGTVSYHGAFLGLSFPADVQTSGIDPKYWRRLQETARDRQKEK
jgi:sulfur-carrier protein adenylyltransferase/sulfurtransferase